MGMDQIIEKKKGLQKKHFIYIAGALLLTLLIVMVVKSSGSSTYRIDKEKLTISTVSNGDFKDFISLTGTVEPITTIFLDVEEGGKVEEIVTEEGEMVKKGDILIKLRNNDLNLSILNSESQLAYHTNELRNTMISMERQKISNEQQLLNIDYRIVKLKRNYEQDKTLYDKGFVSKEDYLVSKESHDLAVRDRELIYEKMVQDSIFRANQKVQMNESLKNMQQNLSMVRQRLNNLNVKAPVDGQLGTLNAEIGESIARGQRIGQIQVLDNFKVVAMVDEHYIDRVRKGLDAQFERQENNYQLAVKKVYPEVRDGQFEIDLLFKDEMPDKLRTGQTYHIKLELGKPVEAVLLPRGGFFQSTGGQWVYVLDASGNFATKRNIKIGRQNMQYYEVLEGLQPDEQIISSSYEFFKDNDRIEFR